jgi:hypothetical protein
MGFIARNQIKQTGEGGDGLALAAIIVGFVFVVIFILYVVVAAALLSNSGPGY